MSAEPPVATPAHPEPDPLRQSSGGAGPQLTPEQPSLARLIEQLPYPVSYIDAQLIYRQCNTAAAATVGRTPEQIVGRTVASVVGADSEVLTLLRRVLESGEAYSGALTFTPPGSTRTAHYRVSYVPDADTDGRTVGVITNVVDVSDLHESEERFRTLFESMTEGVALHELVYEDGRAVDYRILEVNPAFEAQTGLSAAAAEGRLASKLYGTGEAPYLAEYATVAESGHPISFDTYFPPLERHFRITVTGPAPGRFATIFDDVTQRHRSEAALLQSREDLDRAQAVGQVGSWRLDVRENVLRWSDENHRIFGLPIGTPLTYETFLSVVHPADRAFVDAKWQAGLRGEPYDIEHRLLVEGQVKWVREKAFLEYDEAGELLGGFGITQDVTERKSAEEALREIEMEHAAQQERARLARDLHDSVTQALFAATLKAEALTLAEDPPADGTARAAEEVLRLSRGALAQMRALLLELRGEPLEEVPIRQLLRHLVEAAQGRAHVDIRLAVSGDEQLPPALHMPIYRITQEALGNVTRHAAASRAWVDLDVGPDRVRLSVGDDGRGFEPSACDPTHMGLRSMRERAEEAGGRLCIATEPGDGTVITADWQW